MTFIYIFLILLVISRIPKKYLKRFAEAFRCVDKPHEILAVAIISLSFFGLLAIITYTGF